MKDSAPCFDGLSMSGPLKFAGCFSRALSPSKGVLGFSQRTVDLDLGGEQARGGDDHRICRLRIDEIADLGAAFGVVAGDAHRSARPFSRTRSGFSLINACRMRAPCSVSTQKTIVFWKGSPLSLRSSLTVWATHVVRSSMTRVRSKSF